MIIDIRSVPDGTVLDADLCIVGAGAGGISLAREFANSNYRVAVLESGGMALEPETQELYAGSAIGRPYLDLTTCRLRYFGGTTNHWGAWCLPLDEIDFEAREGFPYSGWPFNKTYLDPWYSRAHKVCGLGPYDYAPERFGITPEKVPPAFKGVNFTNKILQVGPIRFGDYAGEMQRAESVIVYLHANATSLAASENGSEIRELKIGTLSGKQMIMRARYYVLAAGGIENPRLMLASIAADRNGIGNRYDLLGRFFMVHLQFAGAVIALSDPYVDLDFLSEFTDAKPWPFFSYVGVTDDAMRRWKLLNLRFMGDYKFAPVGTAVEALKRLSASETGGSLLPDILDVMARVGELGKLAKRKAFYHTGVPIEALILSCNAEQSPNPESRVLLGPDRDALGMQRVAIDWRLSAEDKRGINKVFRLLASEVGRTGFGRLRYLLTEDDTAWPADLRGNEHHMGTTRTHRDPAQGVVDEHCRVHGVANLYVAGSSIFPTGGSNNPTLTIVALALRLADHLKERFA